MARQLPSKGTFVIPARAYQALGAPAAVVEEVSNHVPHSPVPKAVTEYLIQAFETLPAVGRETSTVDFFTDPAAVALITDLVRWM